MSSPVLNLPPELYSKIIESIPQPFLQQTILAFTRALPYCPIPIYHLYQRIRLTHASQVIQLYHRLQGQSGDIAIEWIREFSLETWTVDADVVVNLVRLLRVTALSLFIGPNFAPEHLEEMFDKPMVRLNYLSLRFRPYVQRATYYQFLKGVYFDSVLTVLSQWPPTRLPAISIIQDQDPLSSDLQQTFAQPIVFFRLDPFAALARSPYLQGLASLRLRIPSRHLSRYIAALPGSLPSLQLLDLSACAILNPDLDNIFMRFPKLRHIILDGCELWPNGTNSRETQRDIGRRCALAGVRRAKEREAMLKNWLETQVVLEHPAMMEAGSTQGTGLPRPGRPARRGRKGLATATISLRASPPQHSVPLPAASSPPNEKCTVPKVHILPSPPMLASFSMATFFARGQPEKYLEYTTEFEKGWAEGLTQLSAIRRRYHQSWRNGIRIVGFMEDGDGDGEGFDGLVDLETDDDFFRAVDGEACKPPVLCFSGPVRDETHAVGCGHSVGWSVWKDEL